MPDIPVCIGSISRLQVQSGSLMRETPAGRLFDPAPLREVPELELSASGAIGITQSGERIIDVHHADHPETRYRGMNALSFGFESHLQKMAARFGDHFVSGCAGENIIIASLAVHSHKDFTGTTFIRSADGDVSLSDIMVAEPCAPFARFALNCSSPRPGEIKETLQFLDHGIRGYYCAASSENPIRIRIGDILYTHP